MNSVHFVKSLVSEIEPDRVRIALFDEQEKLVSILECKINDARLLGAQLSAQPPWPQE